VSGVKPANVVILGAGVSGSNACQIAVGVGAHVSVLDINPQRLRYLHDITGGHVTTLMSNAAAVAEEVVQADLVIGSVLIPGARAPRLVTKDLVKRMKPGSAIVDIAIDQGGCCETSRATPCPESASRYVTWIVSGGKKAMGHSPGASGIDARKTPVAAPDSERVTCALAPERSARIVAWAWSCAMGSRSRSLSMTARTPRIPWTGSCTTGTPPPPQTTTRSPAATQRRMVLISMICRGIGDATTRRNLPDETSLMAHPSPRANRSASSLGKHETLTVLYHVGNQLVIRDSRD
jgi:hypothetical protein